jgi:hypothetical protein
LVKLGAGLRWDDTMGIPSSSLAFFDRGFQGSIERSKTTGPGRKTQRVPIFVSRNLQFSGMDWLAAWEILNGMPAFSFPRDFLVPLPTADLDGARRLRAEYHDAAALSALLLGKLRVPSCSFTDGKFVSSEEYLIDQRLLGFWTEHSERRFLNSKAAEIGVPETSRNYLGRWIPKESDAYLVTARATVFSVQDLVAARFLDVPNSFDESEVLDRIAVHMRTLELPPIRIAKQLSVLKSPLLAYYDFLGVGAIASVPELPAVEASSCEPVSESQTAVDNPKYMISYTKKRNTMKIHLVVGGCYRRPGAELSRVSYCNELENDDLALRCKDCFRDRRLAPKGLPSVRDLKVVEDSSDSSNGESSSTDPSGES